MKVERWQVQCSTPGPRCGKRSPLAAQADPGGDLSRLHGPRCIWLQRPRLVVVNCDEIRQDGRTGTFFGCVWLDTATKLQSLQGCSAAPSGCQCALSNDFSILFLVEKQFVAQTRPLKTVLWVHSRGTGGRDKGLEIGQMNGEEMLVRSVRATSAARCHKGKTTGLWTDSSQTAAKLNFFLPSSEGQHRKPEQTQELDQEKDLQIFLFTFLPFLILFFPSV